MKIHIDDPRIPYLQGDIRPWWDCEERKFVPSATVFLAQGCPDWGEKDGVRNELCTFCPLPNAVIEYRKAFYGGNTVPQQDHVDLFEATMKAALQEENCTHTLLIFNAGSFLAEQANSRDTQQRIMREVLKYSTIRRVVIESRAGLVTEEALKPLVEILQPAGLKLTIRIGIETQNDPLRLKVLRKGNGRKSLRRAVEIAKMFDVSTGGYALLKPAHDDGMLIGMGIGHATEREINEWALEEIAATLDWILGNEDAQLGMDEAYFCSTNVGVNTKLTTYWEKGRFRPANLWMVYYALINASSKYGRRVHLLPFKDEPSLLAVPSNHVPSGISQNLDGAQGCDLNFHEMFNRYRESMDRDVLMPPKCSCESLNSYL